MNNTTGNWRNVEKPIQNIQYLATQALKIITTQDGKRIITNQSTVWNRVAKAISSVWTNITK